MFPRICLLVVFDAFQYVQSVPVSMSQHSQPLLGLGPFSSETLSPTEKELRNQLLSGTVRSAKNPPSAPDRPRARLTP